MGFYRQGLTKRFLVFGLILFFPIINQGEDLSIKDYSIYLNPKFKKEPRLSTRFIIIHTSEAGLKSTLLTLAEGKKTGKYWTKGGHAHYAIARNGDIYRIVPHHYRADHTGLSIWDGISNISSHSLGIELVGFHYDIITDDQYRSLSRLLSELKSLYSIPDRQVLTHAQVSFGQPNLWFHKLHRGRKRCALNFNRQKAGLADSWAYDPDVKSGYLSADFQIDRIFYRGEKIIGKKTEKGRTEIVQAVKESISNVISGSNTAWNICGDEFDSSTTVYLLPGGRVVRGDKVVHEVGWHRLPAGTQVMLNQPLEREVETGPLYTITDEYTAWSFAGHDYARETTFYFFPTGKIESGNQIHDWDSIPVNTKMIIGYQNPREIEPFPGKTAWGISRNLYNQPQTLYYIPRQGIISGDKIENFSNLPIGTKIFLKGNTD